MSIKSHGTGKIHDKDILALVKENFDFRLGTMTINLDLKMGGNGRFLSKAAVQTGPDEAWLLCPVTQVEETKQMLRMITILVTET
ncbi:S-adenosylmethionine synthase 2 (Fragment) [Linum perenne]